MSRPFTSMRAIQSILCIFLVLFPSICFAGEWQDLGGGWKFRVDRPNAGENLGKFHIHVNKGNDEVGAENVDGTPSHNDNLNKVPNSIKDKIKDHPEYKKGQKKQADLEKARDQIKAKNLRIDSSNAADVAIAIGIVIACTATVFFPGDDIPAWANLLRLIMKPA